LLKIEPLKHASPISGEKSGLVGLRIDDLIEINAKHAGEKERLT
jgi:hypothetical protein